MASRLFKSGSGLALIVPKKMAERYHLVPGVRMEVIATDDGLFLHPIDVAPWFSIEWEKALDAVVQRHRTALEHLND
ncbi:MAG: AbrB/MazE/SpoVT family DNA-binding domain-containing protein [Dehalococcoidia bacterium]|nr:AbrB/MazE/SpoVT family DNA-binding domain-containing protein [Dehalococcoidia bacterium]